MRKFVVLCTISMALAVGCPSARAKTFRMTCTPASSSIPYTVVYDSNKRASYVTGSRSGITRKYNVIDVKDNGAILYVATKAPGQTRTMYLAFDYSTDGDDVSAIRTIEGSSDKRDKCVFMPSQVEAKGVTPPAEGRAEGGSSVAEAESKMAQAAVKKAESEARIAEAQSKKDIAKIEAEAAATRAKQEAEWRQSEAEQKIALEKAKAAAEKAKADAQERAYALEKQKLREQNDLEAEARIQKTLAVAIPVLGCFLIGTIFIIAIRRRARESAQAGGDGQ